MRRQKELGLKGEKKEWKWLGDEDKVNGTDGKGGKAGKKDWDWKNGNKVDGDGMSRKELVGKSELRGRIVGPIS